MTFLATLLLFHAFAGPLTGPTHRQPADSIGQEMRGGQRFVRHRVGQGETLYALARRYRVTVDQLTAINPELKNGLGIGEIVLVPRPSAAAKATTATTKITIKPATTAVPATYTVAKGETLFGIARRFNLTPAELMSLNHLPTGGSVRVGQELLLRAAASPAVAIMPATTTPATATPVSTATPAADAASKASAAKEAQVATVTPAPTAPAAKEKDHDAPAETKQPTHASELIGRKTEDGVAAIIENSGTDKYLALHKTAPVGTIMEVKNMVNGNSVFVRVIGQLPDTGENQNVLVRISPRAAQKLGTSDAKFRVETSYVP